MPIKKIDKFEAWSYSRQRDYEECPLKAKFKYIDKIKEPDNPLFVRGSTIHKEAQDYCIEKIVEMPESLKRFPIEFEELRRHSKHIEVEKQVAMNSKWEICEWFGQDAWVRVMMDCVFDEVEGSGMVRHIIDFKTGKVRMENKKQLELYAIAGFAMNKLSRVDTSLWYLDQGVLECVSYLPENIDKLKTSWCEIVKPMMEDEEFKARPGHHCDWCYFSQRGGGKQCQY